MKIVNTIEQFKSEIKKQKTGGKTIGFVPTMGALHEGHLALVKESQKNNDFTVVSIFVNPTQFNDNSDFENYPINLNDDSAMLEKENVEVLFTPKYQELYSDNYTYKVSENTFSQILCGAHRPGHFDGVLTVVMKLLNLVQADNAYFGEKDFQQLELIKGMAKAFFMTTKIVACPTVRESDGLALSSRNRRLTPEERERAVEFPQILSAPGLSTDERSRLLQKSGFEVDYIEEVKGRRLAAVKIGNVRLIDNVPLQMEAHREATNSL